MKQLLFLLVLFGITVIVAFLYIKDRNWVLETSIPSPDKRYSLFHYSYLSDGDRHAPYGSYLFLQKTSGHHDPLEGYLVFAGYCDPEVRFAWASDEHIEIYCKALEAKNIRTAASKAYGIQITIHSAVQ